MKICADSILKGIENQETKMDLCYSFYKLAMGERRKSKMDYLNIHLKKNHQNVLYRYECVNIFLMGIELANDKMLLG